MSSIRAGRSRHDPQTRAYVRIPRGMQREANVVGVKVSSKLLTLRLLPVVEARSKATVDSASFYINLHLNETKGSLQYSGGTKSSLRKFQHGPGAAPVQ